MLQSHSKLSVGATAILFLLQSLSGQSLEHNLQKATIDFVFVKADSFQMGDIWGDGDSNQKIWNRIPEHTKEMLQRSTNFKTPHNDEKPVHTVFISDFEISRHEITNGQFSEFLNDNIDQFDSILKWITIGCSECMIEYHDNRFYPKSGYENHPVINITWHGAQAFAKWINGRLPTEAEWEFSARSKGKKNRYPWGNEFDGTKLNFADKNTNFQWSSSQWDDGYAFTSPVGSFSPNELGLYDMAGNAAEWCLDWYDEYYYSQSPKVNPKGAVSGIDRVVRGGNWFYVGESCRTTRRLKLSPNKTYKQVGFRVVRPIEPDKS